MATTEKPVMVIGIDDSQDGIHALEWTLDHLFSSTIHPFKLVVVHAKPLPTTFIGVSSPGMVVGSAGTFKYMDEDLKKLGAIILENARGICVAKLVHDVVFEMEEGDARYVLCDAVGRHHASMLVVGSHGYGAIKRAFLGSASDYCAHQAPCSVMIVKSPKTSP